MRYSREHDDFPEIKARLGQAFAGLRKKGFVARQNFMCCGGCASAAIPETTSAWVFYHKQDGDDLRTNGQCYLAFGGDKNASTKGIEAIGQLIVDFLRDESLEVEWDGTAMHRILVKGLKPAEPEATYLDLVGAVA